MGTRKKSYIDIKSNLLNKNQYIELQERTDCFLIIGRGIEAKNDEEEQFIKEISKKYNLDNGSRFFSKEFSTGITLSDVYKAIQNIIHAMCEFEKEKNVTKILSVRIPAELKAKLSEEKNTSELVRDLLEKHFEK